MKYSIASTKDRAFSLTFALTVGALFAAGFLSTTQNLYTFFSRWIPPVPAPWAELKEMAFFPMLCAIFCLSLPKRGSGIQRRPNAKDLRMSILPILIALGFGQVIGNHWKWNFNEHLVDTVWYLAFIPFGEECLFRGWLYGILDRVWPGKMLTASNPLPISVWGSALAFSVWHIQNVGNNSPGLVAFQVAYTLITGLWLGVLRQSTGQVWPGVFAHSFINLAAGT